MSLLQFRIVLFFSSGYLISYLFRGVNLGFAPSLIRDFGIGPTELGLITSFYFLGFALIQIPAGVLIDHYGPRRINMLLLFVAAVGAGAFSLASTLEGLMFSRLCIGMGVAACLGAAFKAFAQWFKIHQLPAINGLVMAVGGIGGVITGAPLERLLHVTDWRHVSLGLSVLTFMVVFCMAIFVPDAPFTRSDTDLSKQIKGVVNILKNRVFYRITLFSITTQGVFYTMQSLWLGPFLQDVYQMTAANAAEIVSIVGIMMIIGCLSAGLLAHWLYKKGITLYTFTGFTMGLFLLDQFFILLQVPINPLWLWGAFGLLGSCGFLTYALLPKHFSIENIGRVNATMTLLIFLLIFALQSAIGLILSRWATTVIGHFPREAHLTVLAILIMLQFIGGMLYIAPHSWRLRKHEL